MQCICLQEENLDLMTQKVLLTPNNLECSPTLNVQLCSFLRDSICMPVWFLMGDHQQLIFF